MTQPVPYAAGIVSKGTFLPEYATQAEANRFDFRFRFFVAPPGSGVVGRAQLFTLGSALPGEVTSSLRVLAAAVYTNSGSVTVTQAIPAIYPYSGEAFVGINGEYRVMRWENYSGSTFTGVTWPAKPDGRTYFPAGATVEMWVDVSSRITGNLQLSTNTERQIVSWGGNVDGVNYNSVLLGKDCYIAIARSLSTNPIGGVWGSEKLFRLGMIRSLPGVSQDSSLTYPFSIRISGLMDMAKTVGASPLAIGNRDVARGAGVNVSTTVLNVETLQNESRGDFVGVPPSVTSENIVDDNMDTFWCSEGVPYEERENLINHDYGLMIDELYVTPPTGLNEDYRWIALWNPNTRNVRVAHNYHIVVGHPDLQWARWLDRTEDNDPANDDDPAATGHLGPYMPPGTPGITPWVAYPNRAWRLPGGIEIPPHSKIIVCRNATKFLDTFDAGGAQVVEIPGLELPAANAVIKVMGFVSGAAPGTQPGDTLIYGSPTYPVLPSYWTDNVANPLDGYSIRRRYPGDISRGNQTGTNFILDAHPSPGDIRDRKRREWVHIDLSDNAIGLFSSGSIGTGALTELRFVDAGGDSASTYKLDKAGKIKFQGSAEEITYADNNGAYLTGISRGVSPQAVSANTRVAQMVGAQATFDVSTTSIRIQTKPSGPVFGSIEVYGSRLGSNTVTPPPVIVPERDDFVGGTVGDGQYWESVNNWRSDWDLIWSGDVYDHFKEVTYPPRRSRHMLVVINSMPMRATVTSQASGVLGGNVVVRSTANLVGMDPFMRHAGVYYDYDSIVSLGNDNYQIINVQPKSQNLVDVSQDTTVFLGRNRARVSNISIMQSNLVGENGLMVGDGDTDILFKYILGNAIGLSPHKIVHIDRPVRITSLTTSRSSVAAVLADICRRHGLMMIEWPDMTIEIFGDPWRPQRFGYTGTVYGFHENNSVKLVNADSSPEDVSQVEVTVTNPITGQSHTAKYPARPYRTGNLYREPDLVGTVGASDAFMIAAGTFVRLRNGKTVTIIPTGPADWLYPPMMVDSMERDKNSVWGWSGQYIVESVNVTYSIGKNKAYALEATARRLS